MKLIIDISEEIKSVIDKNGTNEIVAETLWQAVKNGTPIPDKATNGNSVIKIFCKGIVRISSRKNVSVEFNKNWWNAVYQKGGK